MAGEALRPAATSALVGDFFRRQYGELVSTLARVFGFHRLQLVEDAVGAALLLALTAWSKGVPDDPTGWLYRVAHHKMVDTLRQLGVRSRLAGRVQQEAEQADAEEPPARLGQEIEDDLLRMLFVCCDEALPPESQLVLALKTLCGFGTREIARRLFTSEANVHKRLERARDRLREREPSLETPDLEAMRRRLPTVQRVLYLLFNEGYSSSQPDQVIRHELCLEAIRLALLLVHAPVGDVPSTRALLALFHLHAARLDARLDSAGGLLLIDEQDRSAWDRDLIRVGMEWLDRAAEGDEFTRYHAEAAVAAEHCLAPSFAATRWAEIVDLYQILERLAPSPLHTLNRAIAVAQMSGPAAGLAILEELRPPAWLYGYYLWDAALGDLHRKAGSLDRAVHHLERALAGAPTEPERVLLRKRLASCRS